jgi:WD40 repeat protein
MLMGWVCATASGSLDAAAPPAGGVRLDRYGDPLPEGAFARLGTGRFRADYDKKVAVAPDGKSLAVPHGKRGVRILDATTGRELRRWQAEAEVVGVSYCPTGKLLAVQLEAPHGVQLFSPDGRRSRSLPLKDSEVLSAVFSRNGKVLAVVVAPTGGDVLIHLFDPQTGKAMRSLRPIHRRAADVAISPDGKLLCHWGEEKIGSDKDLRPLVQVWDVSTGKELHCFDAGGPVGSATFSPDGKALVIAAGEGSFQVWSLASGKRLRAFRGRSDATLWMGYSPDGKVLLASGASAQAWDVKTGQRIPLPVPPVQPDRFLAPTWTTDVRALRAYREGGAVVLLDLFAGRAAGLGGQHHSAVTSLVFRGDGRLLSADAGATVLEWDRRGNLRRSVRRGADPVIREGPSSTLSPDGKYVLSSSSDDPCRDLHELADGRKVLSFPEVLIGAVFSPDGALLAGAGGREMVWDTVFVWRLSTGEEVSFSAGNQVLALAFAPGGKKLAVWTGDEDDQHEVRLVDVRTGKPCPAFVPRKGEGVPAFPRLVFSPDGAFLAMVPFEGSVLVLDAATGALVRSLPFDGKDCSGAAFSPDGRTLALAQTRRGSDRSQVALLELSTGQKRWERSFDVWPITTLAFSPDGRVLATGHGDSTILLWDVTGRELARRNSARKLTARERSALWAELHGDAEPSYRATRALAGAPGEAVALFRTHVRPDRSKPLPAETMARLIRELDSDDFATRERAAVALEQQGEAAEKALRQALEGKPSLEMRRRLERLLGRLRRRVVPPEVLRVVRAIEVLEWIDTAEARQLLTELAKGRADRFQTREASKALARLRALGKAR